MDPPSHPSGRRGNAVRLRVGAGGGVQRAGPPGDESPGGLPRRSRSGWHRSRFYQEWAPADEAAGALKNPAAVGQELQGMTTGRSFEMRKIKLLAFAMGL